MFDATELEIARRETAYELGAESNEDRRWSRWYKSAEMSIISNGWDEKFTGGQALGKSRGLDGCDWETGYSIDGAYDAFEAGRSVQDYIAVVALARMALGL